MASSLISNTNQVYFASILGMDNEGMVAMFEALISSGLNGFLGCSSAIYEAALVEFFQNASVRDGQVVSTVQGKPVEISEELFARTFELPMEGLTDMHEVPKDLLYDARSKFSFNGEQFSTSCKKREMKIEFKLLNNILAKSVTVKAGSFDAVTHEHFLMMSAINGGFQINWGRLLFNILKDMVTPGSRQAKGYAELEIIGVDEIAKIVEQQDNELTADDVDTIIEKILADTTQMEADAGETEVGEQIVQKSEETVSQCVISAAYFVEEPIEEMEKNQGTEISDVVQTTDEDSMSLDELLATIPHGSVLPSTIGEITKIQLGRSITIRGVNEEDWYKASLPKIPVADKDMRNSFPSEHRVLCTSDSVEHTAQEPLVQGDTDLIADIVEPIVHVSPDSIPTDTAFDQDDNQRSYYSSSSSSSHDLMDVHVDTPVHFTSEDIPLGTEIAVAPTLPPNTAITPPNFSESFSQIRDLYLSYLIEKREPSLSLEILSTFSYLRSRIWRQPLLTCSLSKIKPFEVFSRVFVGKYGMR
ncbi:hypothetical protein F511_42621 [Dorcoceras hygrometricum]|uniref:Dystroglycan-like n=1 Tax=Dorcoceras hygrometricum TaxID=472368 RepID=A0A2Z7CI93_9LAMI|nr:hypothetical protein F511_42621 [Dorcoceras hygrometricum]